MKTSKETVTILMVRAEDININDDYSSPKQRFVNILPGENIGSEIDKCVSDLRRTETGNWKFYRTVFDGDRVDIKNTVCVDSSDCIFSLIPYNGVKKDALIHILTLSLNRKTLTK